MAVSTGLRSIRKTIEETQTGGGTKWLKMGAGDQWKIRFIDDLDDSAQTELGAGKAVLIKEHQAGKNFMRKAQCTKNDDGSGECFGCEMAVKHRKTGWARKNRVYINVLVNDGVNDPYVAVWSMGTQKSPTWDALVDFFEEDDTISNRDFRVKRNGTGTDTTYLLRALEVDSEPFDFAAYERFDLNKVVREVAYEDQEAYYLAGDEEASEVEEPSTTEW